MMKYFHGFSLKDEAELFTEYLLAGDTTVAGFSYGAQQAFEYVYTSSERIDRLILLSPAFFQTQNEGFIRTQLHYYKKDKEAYLQQFLKNVTYPSTFSLHRYIEKGDIDALSSLLKYVWDVNKLKQVIARGTKIEVWIGAEDKIINAQETGAFFKAFCTVYRINNAGHLLKDRDD